MFVVSWVNPDAKLAHKDFEDYLTDGTLAALDAIEKATGEKSVNAIGYCLGGTLLAGDARLHGREEGQAHRQRDLHDVADRLHARRASSRCSSTRRRSSSLEKKMAERGYLEGAEMANTFNLLRANDLIWTFVINNYLLGRDPFPFDLLHWNCDSTRMPAKMHSFYLRNMYMKNLLREPGGLTLDGVKIDLSKVSVPTYFVSAIEDHIAPWKTTYAGPSILGGKSRFVLSGSGHIAGMVNPPAAEKYGFWTNAALARRSGGLARRRRRSIPGSWWTDWLKWVGPHLGREVPARVPGKGKLKVIEAAPGSYARLRADAG